jgi:hypothetical protein
MIELFITLETDKALKIRRVSLTLLYSVTKRWTSGHGPSRHSTATYQFSHFLSKADIQHAAFTVPGL